MVQMFVPSVSRPTRQEVEKEIQKLYPDAKVLSFLPRDLEPGEPTVMMGEEYLSELKPSTLGSYIKKASTSRAALAVSGTLSKKPGTNVPDINARKSDTLKSLKRGKMIDLATNKLVKKASKGGTIRGASPDSTQYFSQEEYVVEDDMKGMSVKSGHKRPTKSGAGMTAKGVAAYRRRNPGSKLKTAVTGKVKKGSKDAKRRKSYCARSAGQMKKFPKAAKDPNSRLRQARRRWNC